MKTLIAAIILLILLYLKSKHSQRKINVAHKIKAPRKQKKVRKKIIQEKIEVSEEKIKGYLKRFEEAWKPVGNLKPECPYCAHKFEKMPQAKRKCPSCKETFYSRKIPQKDQKSLLREEDLPILEKQHNAITYIKIHTNKKDPEYQNAYKNLKKKFGAEPLENDVLWRVFNNRILETASSGDFGLMRNAYLEAAEILRKEKNFLNSLLYHFYVCHLDINGVSNGMHQMREYGLDSESFRKDIADIAPHVSYITKKLIELADLSLDEQEEIYYYSMNKYDSFPYPIYNYRESWERLKKELEE